MKKLSTHSGKLISQAQLEVILGVDSVRNQDIRKVRRSRGIQYINAQAEQILGSTIITRVRDASDKRVILYQISNLASPLSKTTEPKDLKI
ncbi:MAG: hypothetical protein MUE75_07345 [Algoriphagus sp.]|nr:hypothetical protein [Algoriphagus sp.]